MSHTIRRRSAVAIAAAGTLAASLVSVPGAAVAAPDGSGLVINEVYGGGGNSGAPLSNDFVELFNPTGERIALAGLRLEYKSSGGGSGGSIALDGEVEPGAHFLVQLAAGSGSADSLPAADQIGSMNMSGTNGRVYLYEGEGQFPATAGDLAGAEGLVDMVGYGSAVSFETSATPRLSNATSVSRGDGVDSDDNSADFDVGDPSPVNAAGETAGSDDPEPDPTDPPESVEVTIAEVQGTGDASPRQGETVTVEGVVTADWRDGGFNGFTMQDPAGDPRDGASDAIFVWGDRARAEVGQSVAVTGAVSEHEGLTEITVDAITVLGDDLGDVVAVRDWSLVQTDEGKEAHESELVQFDAPFTVTDNYDANFFGSFGLAFGEQTLRQPTDDIDPHDTAAVSRRQAENAAKSIVLDDARSTNFNNQADVPLSYLTPGNPVRVGAQVEFAQPLVLDYRYDGWKLQPTVPVSGDGSDVVTFSDERAANASPQDVGGDLTIATFNVLNYFPTTAQEFVDAGLGECTYYLDREGTPIGANRCEPNGPRGAATVESFERQEAKIVTAITASEASIVSLEEIENSSHYGKDRDVAVAALVDALNEEEGEGVWDYAPSPEQLPSAEDVIRNAFIYRTADVDLVGASHILVDDPAFDNAREPVFQGFRATGDDEAFLVAANHFKSKGSGVDDGTGQGNANPDRIRQAEALTAFSNEVQAATGIDAVFLAGDFNAYAAEDPAREIESAGYTNLNVALNGGEATYNYDGLDGSLDHVFANDAALDLVTGVDVWQINAQEQVGFEYSRYNYNATLLYDESIFRASDHNPILVGIGAAGTDEPSADEWQRGAVYDTGDTVRHEGATFVAQWWTTQEPGTTPWGSWMERGESISCAEGDVAAWTTSQVYTGGERVAHEGGVFEARWWTRNQAPSTSNAPWERVGTC